MNQILSPVVVSGALLAALSVACGPSLEPGHILTPEERLQQEEMKAYEAEKNSKGSDTHYDVTEEAEEFDKKQAEMELKRASLSAQTCDDVVDAKNAKGIADVSIVFGSDGKVREASVAPPYADGPIGDCILNAYKAVIVPPFKEAEYAMSWQLDLSGKQKEEDAESAALEKKIFGSPEGEEEAEEEDAKKKPSKKKK